MLTYLIILLDETSVSYCHYENTIKEHRLIDIDVLKRGIIWAMKENLNIQFVYPNYPLPKEYKKAIEAIDHSKIGPLECGEELDVVVVDSLLDKGIFNKCILWRCTLQELIGHETLIKDTLDIVSRLNIVLTDIPQWKHEDFNIYQNLLEQLVDYIAGLYENGKSVQFNLLTDRLSLRTMNNCNAGDSSLVLAPNGKFYICPAFYPNEDVGSLERGLIIRNQQLYKLDYAPICRVCDAFQCKRCIWMNQNTTLDCNTPSHEQCVVAHLERNASRLLQEKLQESGIRLKYSHEIPEIDYLDPFNIVNKWK